MAEGNEGGAPLPPTAKRVEILEGRIAELETKLSQAGEDRKVLEGELRKLNAALDELKAGQPKPVKRDKWGFRES